MPSLGRGFHILVVDSAPRAPAIVPDGCPSSDNTNGALLRAAPLKYSVGSPPLSYSGVCAVKRTKQPIPIS